MKGIEAKDPTKIKTDNLEKATESLTDGFMKVLPPTRRFGLEIRKQNRMIADAALDVVAGIGTLRKFNLTQEQAAQAAATMKILEEQFKQKTESPSETEQTQRDLR